MKRLMSGAVIVGVMLTFLAAGCGKNQGPSAGDVIEARKPEALKKRDALVTVLDAAAKLPALKAPEGAVDPAMDVQPLARNSPATSPSWNCLVLHDVQVSILRDPSKPGPAGTIWLPERASRLALEAAVTGRADGSPADIKSQGELNEWFDALAGLKYAIVIHSIEYTLPMAEGKTFTQGRCVCEARVYRLEGATYLGGFRFAASGTSESVQAWGGKSQMYVEIDFKRFAEAAFNAELKKLFPGTGTEIR
ncbi:MAG: hypothetical protein AAB074_21675 [Planctomycetota bacterium]